MLRGIKSSWKQVVAYYFIGSSHHEIIRSSLLQVLSALSTTGASVFSTVCDQGSFNRKLYKMLGVTIEHPFFTYGGKRYYAFHDSPHLMKSVRNNLLRYDIKYSNGTAKRQCLQEFLNNDLRSTIRYIKYKTFQSPSCV